MKKLINDRLDVVDEMLEGIVGATSELALLPDARVIVRADAENFKQSGKVALISGGGSGHEPAHAGYVGAGLLSAAVCGDVFTSPSTDAVLAAIRAVTGPAGALLIVKHYTGDRLNFGLAAEMARLEGFAVEMVIVGDDVALGHAVTETAGRRGLAGTVLIHKIAGSAAEAGLPLAEVKAAAEAACNNLATMGVGLTPCIVPAAGEPNFTLAEDEIELGLGIHGEAGVSRVKLLPADQIVDILCERIFAGIAAAKGESIALLINNLGATPGMELAIIARHALAKARAAGLTVEAIWVGTFLTAIEMAGCSISVLRLDTARLAALQSPASSLNWVTPRRPSAQLQIISQVAAAAPPAAQRPADPAMAAALHAVIAALTRAEAQLTELDQKAADGDLGQNLARGALAIAPQVERLAGLTPVDLLQALSLIVRKVVGGTSGALYAAGLLRAAGRMADSPHASASDWAAALAAGAAAIGELGDSKVGDRTMLDALQPAALALQEGLASGATPSAALQMAVRAADQGAAATAEIAAKRGRSSYMGDRVTGIEDPGARAVAIWLGALADRCPD